MGELIRMVKEPCVQCDLCGSQSWYVMLNPDDHEDMIRLECANPDCNAIVPFEEEDGIELILE